MSQTLFTPAMLAEAGALRRSAGGTVTDPARAPRPTSIHECHAWFFVEAFPGADPDAVRALSTTTALLVRAWARAPFGTAPDLAEENGALAFASGLFPPESAFWSHVTRYLAEARSAAAVERSAAGNTPGRRWDVATAMQAATGRYGVARVSVAGLAALGGRPDHLDALEDAIGWVDAACAALAEVQLEERRRAAGLPCAAAGGAARGAAGAALDALTRAGAATAHLPGLGFRRVIAFFEERASALFGALPAPPAPAGSLVAASGAASEHMLCVAYRTALEHLLSEADAGFREAGHVMPFPAEQGFSCDREVHRGDVFARALVADALCDALCDAERAREARLTADLSALVDREVDHLIGCRRRSGVGAWSYFPDLLELPPDADDLAQVLQLVVRRRPLAAVAPLVEPALRVLLGDGAHADGSFETWIVPAARRSPEQALQARWAELAWGTGADPEVVANLLFALETYDPARFRGVISGGATYLETCQSEDGCFPTGWYHGPFYGTWVAARLLARVRPGSPALVRTACYLLAAQLGDGGFGLGPESDPLSTALGLLALSATAAASGLRRDVAAAARAARDCLDRFAASGDLVRAVPFIRMDLGRPTGTPWQTLTYESRTLTAAFVAKALLASRDLDRAEGTAGLREPLVSPPPPPPPPHGESR